MKKRLSMFIFFVLFIFSNVIVNAATAGDELQQPENGWKRYEVVKEGIADNRITYEGDWGGQYYSYKTTNFIKFNFVGTELRLIRRLSSYSSKNLSVTIDGIKYQTDNKDSMPEYTPVIMFEIKNLANVEHAVVIDTTTADSAHHVSLDYIDMDENGELKGYDESPIQIEAPTNLTAQSSDYNITLNWDAVEGADNYTILRSTTLDAIDTIIGSSEETTYIDSDVEPGITYYYIVRAVKNSVESTDSNIASAMIKKVNPAVLQIKLSTTDIYEFRVTMNEAENFIKWYIDRSNDNGLPFYKFAAESEIEPYTDANEYLIYNKIVWFKVKEYIKQ
ncbi:fibronectin type III domain-containing protein [Vallitalea guaymasensis]|uniref:Fibronectin type III domain-containing protein n=1 Tax=Vallitalea guaymasensis TaxID=1185412 RepID=A0A8J8SAP2_9FIRM|nr:fibronectin type III domain-containing protein [Vallitalea guaymasensis]QUH27789.1 fibronectin type III domain-containing protein [Vallitalea guaymasensis]